MVKLHASESVNGGPPPAEEPEDDREWAGEEDQYDYSNLFNAPNYSAFIKTAPNSKAKSYEVRVASLMKAGAVMSIHNRQYPDAATFLKHGPGFAKAAGNLAAEDARVAAMVEMLTAPESPYVMFALVAIPLVSQLFRNHQSEIGEAGATIKQKRAQRRAERKAGVKQPSTIKPIKFKLFKREITVPIRIRLKFPNPKHLFKAFLAPTQYPEEIAHEVFSDPLVVKALHNMGLYPRQADEQDAA